MSKVTSLFNKAVAATKSYIQRAKLIFTRIETAAHAAIVAAIGGGVSTLWEQYHAAGHVAFTAEKFAEMKVHFLWGAGIALAAWLKQAPALKPPTSPQP